MDKRDWKRIYRRVKSKPVFMKDGRPSSALFKDSHGVSVDKDMGRNEKDIFRMKNGFIDFITRD